jgi:hypothetical protein
LIVTEEKRDKNEERERAGLKSVGSLGIDGLLWKDSC